MIDWLCTRERAIEHAFELAHDAAFSRAVSVVVERGDGSIEEVHELRRAIAS
jgi:hypothetical protein